MDYKKKSFQNTKVVFIETRFFQNKFELDLTNLNWFNVGLDWFKTSISW
jgi:hypothetical protein